MKRVLHLRSSGGILGAENVIIELAKRSDNYGFESYVGAIHNAQDQLPEFLNTLAKTKVNTSVFSGKGRFDFKRIRELRKYIISNKIDIIHSHGYKEDFHSLFLQKRIPKIATNHLWKKMNLTDKLYCALDSVILHFFDMVVGVSSEIVTSLRNTGISDPVKILNGIDIERFKPAEDKSEAVLNQFRISKIGKVVGMISSLTSEKNHITAIRALSLIREDVTLLIVGDGVLKNDLIKFTQEQNLTKRVIFAGKQYDVPSILSIVDIFIIPSLKEGLPMALLEAMAAGKAVIASRVGEIPNIINDTVNGLLIDAKNYNQLAASIEYLFSNPAHADSMKLQARADICQTYSADHMAKNYCELYNSLLKKKRTQ